jgi:DNA polymerase alpha subunit A
MRDVYDEVDQIMIKLKVNEHKIKPCTRKYAFDLPPDIPKTADYLKLLYSYESKSIATVL